MSEMDFGLRRLLDREGATCPVCDGLRIVLPNLPAGHRIITPLSLARPAPIRRNGSLGAGTRWSRSLGHTG